MTSNNIDFPSSLKKGNSITNSESLTRSEQTSSDALASLQTKFTSEVFSFLFLMQNNHQKKGRKQFLLFLLLYGLMLWNFVWIPVLSPTDMKYGTWGGWILTVLNYPTSLSMDLLPYFGALIIACVGMVFLLVMIVCYGVGYRAVLSTSRFMKRIQKVVFIMSFITLLLSAPLAFILTSFVDCDYGYIGSQSRSAILGVSFSSSNSTSISKHISLYNLNRFPQTACFSTENSILFALAIIFILLILGISILSTFIIPNSQPLNRTPMIFDSALLQTVLVGCNVVSIAFHYLIPPEYSYARSIAHILLSLIVIVFVFKTIPMMRRFENSIVAAVVCGRLGTSIGGLISVFVNPNNQNDIGVGMAALTIGKFM